AAMAPATHLGAATPISIGASPTPTQAPESGRTEDSGRTDKPVGQSSPAVLRHKVVNDAVAFIRSLADQRGRNADWAEQAVRQAATLTAAEALDRHVIDVVAANRADLLEKIDGMTVTVAAGNVTLHTANAHIVQGEPGWRTGLLGVITQPTVAYLLMLI